MTFFFDNNISPKLVGILQLLDVDAKHLREEFPADTEDIDWIPQVGAKGWIVVTADKRIRRSPAEIAALRQNHVSALFLKDSFLKKHLWEQAEWLIKHWRAIETEAQTLRPGTSAILRENGRLEILK